MTTRTGRKLNKTGKKFLKQINRDNYYFSNEYLEWHLGRAIRKAFDRLLSSRNVKAK